MHKQTIILIIDDFTKGGAEILLAGILPELNKRYRVLLVTLTDNCDFNKADLFCDQKFTLGFSSKVSFFSCIIKLIKIIKKNNPVIVHSHLLYSSIIARIACPRNIPLVYSIHSIMSKAAFNNSSFLTWLEKNTIKNSHTLIAVSNEAFHDYEQTIKMPIRKFVLKNYINDSFLVSKKANTILRRPAQLRLVAVGNLKVVKNYSYMVESFKLLKQYDLSLDIYGQDQGNLTSMLQSEIKAHQLPIILKGKADAVNETLGNYDIYVMCSKYEGFGLAAIEAAALGLPLLLTDLPVLREITFNNALFFDIDDPSSFAGLIKDIFAGKYDLNAFAQKGIEIVTNNYTKEIYLKNLFGIYDKLIETGSLQLR